MQDDVPAVRVAAAGAAADAMEKLRPNPDEEVATGGFLGLGKRTEPKARDMEQWLTRFREGGGRPDWTNALAEPLERMAAGKAPGATPAEALAAAVPLAAMGKDGPAVPVLQGAARSADPATRRAAAAALPWLPWAERAALFKELTTRASRDELAAYVQTLSKMPSPPAADVLWDVLALPAADASLASAAHSSLRRIYLGNRYYDRSEATKPKRDALAEVAKARLAGPSDTQRFVALALLAEQTPEQAIEPAERLVKERPADDPLKVDAFTILLLAKDQQPGDNAAAADAVAALAGDAPYEMKKVAVKYLATEGRGPQPAYAVRCTSRSRRRTRRISNNPATRRSRSSSRRPRG